MEGKMRYFSQNWAYCCGCLSFGVGQKTENKAGSDVFIGDSFGAMKHIYITQQNSLNFGREENSEGDSLKNFKNVFVKLRNNNKKLLFFISYHSQIRVIYHESNQCVSPMF